MRDFSSPLNALAESETEAYQGSSPVIDRAPLVEFSGHQALQLLSYRLSSQKRLHLSRVWTKNTFVTVGLEATY